jgi:PKD repeat protein
MKKINFLQILGLILLVFTFNVNAQEFKCGSAAAQENMYRQHPELRQQQKEFDEYVRNYVIEHYNESNRNTVVIPMVFHVIHDYGTENISDDQILDQVAILNRDYNLLNDDTSEVVRAFKSIYANVGIEFKLAQKDPQGNCTNGIDRIASGLTYLGNDAAKLNPWDRRSYLNVWTVKKMENGVAGYAYKPLSVSGQNYHIDGIIILHDYIGSTGTSSVGHSRALTHEIGHWLNLSHPWGDNNTPGEACGDDGIPDTPITKGHTDCVPVVDFTCDINNFANATYNFNNVTINSGSVDNTTPPNQLVNSVHKVDFTNFRALGVSTNSTLDTAFAFKNWDTGAIDGDTLLSNFTGNLNTSKYYEFTLTPTVPQAMTLATLTFKVGRNDYGIRSFAIRSSLNNFSTNLTGGVVTPANPNLVYLTSDSTFFIKYDTNSDINGARINLAGFANLDKAVTFRIYGFNAEADSGTFMIDDVTIAGTFGTVENVQNYMDYSYCSVMFTHGQSQAMHAALSADISFRNNLWSENNLIQTGVLNPTTCAPKADFYTTTKFVCAGSSVAFKDNSVNAVPTSWNWTFTGGTPATSNVKNPVITYNTPGYYPVTLSVSNASGSNSLTKTSYIYVSPNWSDYTSNYVEGFEDAGLTTRWFIVNPANNSKAWQRVSDVSASGASSIMLNGFVQSEGDVDELISPSYDLRYTTNLNLSFKYIGASKATLANEITDSLTVYVSTDCGKTWGTAPRLTIKRTNLIKAGQTDVYYKPNPGDTWTTATVNLGNSFAVPNVRFRFRYTSGVNTNNFYIDDINISGIVSLDELNNANNQLSVYPNPFETEAILTLNTVKTEKVNIDLLDITGRKVSSIFNGVQNDNVANYKIEKQNLSQGVYLIKAQVGENTIIKKVIIE